MATSSSKPRSSGPTHRSPLLPSAVMTALGSMVLMTYRACARAIRCLRLDCVQSSSTLGYYRTEKYRGQAPQVLRSAYLPIPCRTPVPLRTPRGRWLQPAIAGGPDVSPVATERRRTGRSALADRVRATGNHECILGSVWRSRLRRP